MFERVEHHASLKFRTRQALLWAFALGEREPVLHVYAFLLYQAAHYVYHSVLDGEEQCVGKERALGEVLLVVLGRNLQRNAFQGRQRG